jgi:hypothetical protein
MSDSLLQCLLQRAAGLPTALSDEEACAPRCATIGRLARRFLGLPFTALIGACCRGRSSQAGLGGSMRYPGVV